MARSADDIRPDPPLSRAVAERMADTMFALANPHRLQILSALRDGTVSVSELVARLGLEQSAVSHQLRVLRENRLVRVQRAGRRRLYALIDDSVEALLDGAAEHLDRTSDGRRARRERRSAS